MKRTPVVIPGPILELIDKGWLLGDDGKMTHPIHAPLKPITPLTAILRDQTYGLED